METGEFGFLGSFLLSLFSVFLSFFSKPLEVFSSGGDMWTRTSQKPCKILKNQKNDSSMEMP